MAQQPDGFAEIPIADTSETQGIADTSETQGIADASETQGIADASETQGIASLQKQRLMHIAITGNIGAGKTTLAELLAAHYGWEVLYEAVEGNPYLADFYSDMPRWSFNLQIYFLNSRFAQIKKIIQIQQSDQTNPTRPHTLVQDRTIYEDAAIFARNLHEGGYMAGRDYETYQHLFTNMMSLVRPPDLMIYLRADLSKLRQQIQKRGRSYEQAISDDYLSSLNRLYEEFVASYHLGPLLILDVATLDYAKRAADFGEVVNQVNARLASLSG